jgi:dephospho-CoA kinase
MLKVGLTGGLATGKTFVGTCLKDLGCHVIEADQLGHQVMEPGGEAYPKVVEAFGPGILNPDGTIDRRKLAALVFGDAERLAVLSSFVHPPVYRLEAELLAQAERSDPEGIAVVEAAILIETGSYNRFARLILAVCSEEEQIRRSMKRDGVTRDEVVARIRNQMPLEEKRHYADYIIDTSESKQETVRRVAEVYDSLRSLKL